MAFLDNSGDIILDAVLTDAGRKRLARGDGTFKITKYAFGDDEINYGTYDPNHASGSAYFDLEILQTPVLEAFTNNRSSLKSRLISLTNNNLLFLPELVLNENANNLKTQRTPDTTISTEAFAIPINASTYDQLTSDSAANFKDRVLFGYGTPNAQQNYVRIDQGLNTEKLDATNKLSAELTEQQYLLTIDNRFGSITDVFGGTIGSPSFIDDDQIATYYVTQNVGEYVQNCAVGQLTVTSGEGATYVGGQPEYEVISGPRGTKLRFGIMASDNLKASDYLFDTIGRTAVGPGGSTTYKIIDSTIKVVGVTTGYHLDVPVAFAKKQGT